MFVPRVKLINDTWSDGYLRDWKQDVFDQLRLMKHLDLFNDVNSVLQDYRFVQVARLYREHILRSF